MPVQMVSLYPGSTVFTSARREWALQVTTFQCGNIQSQSLS
jgi:hypothetical protein